MTAAEQIANEVEERDLARNGAVRLWGRSWKADLIVALKAEHDEQTASNLAYSRVFPRPKNGKKMDEDDERIARMAKTAAGILAQTRELMLRLALHPTCPKARGSATPGAGRPPSGLVTDLTVVPDPTPEAAPDAEPMPVDPEPGVGPGQS
jgi:hypothetical protein